jgi:urease accessory protein
MAEWLIWQLADSAFPAGAFAHSSGLEAAWQQGEVDAASLPAFVDDVITQAGHAMLPFVTTAHPLSSDLGGIDARCEAFLRNPVSNRASRMQGRAWLRTVGRAFVAPAVRAVCEAARAQAPFRHYAVMFGATLGALKVQLQDTQRLFLFGVCRGTLSAAVRLGLAGTMDAQQLLAEAAAHLDRTVARCSALTIDEAAQTMPLLDLWQSGHDRLYSRLFQS